MFQYLGSFFLGWSIGANHSSILFGTAVNTHMISFKKAILLGAVFVILGAVLQSEEGILTLSQDLQKHHNNLHMMRNATIISVMAALTVTTMTILKLPVASSQAVIGAIFGMGIIRQAVVWDNMGKVLGCWILTPFLAGALTLFLYYFFRYLLKVIKLTVFQYDPLMRFLLIVCGCYAAYALGANNTANIAAVFVGPNMLTVRQAAWLGGISMAIGILTYSRPVMQTVGSGIVKIDAFLAFVCVLSHGLAVHFFALIGVPVASSQAMVGALLTVGLIKGIQVVNFKTVGFISLAWIITPLLSAGLTILSFIFCEFFSI